MFSDFVFVLEKLEARGIVMKLVGKEVESNVSR